MEKPDSKGADRPFASKNHHLRSRLRVQALGLDQGRQQTEIAGALHERFGIDIYTIFNARSRRLWRAQQAVRG